MNKATLILTALMSVASLSLADPEILSRGSFSASGDGAEVTIPATKGGAVRNIAFSATLQTNANLTVHRPKVSTEAAAAVAASTTVTVICASSNTVSGFTPTTSDFLLVRDTGSNGYQLRQISGISSYNSTTKVQTYVVASNVTCADESPVYVVDASNDVVIPLTTSSASIPYAWLFTGYASSPVTLKMVAGSGPATVISGTYDVER